MTTSIANTARAELAAASFVNPSTGSGRTVLSALRFITCGSVDDGKSTLIGRLLVDSKSVLQDQLAGVSKSGAADLALLTDGLAAEREQGITIDVAYRYFATPMRKFIIGDAPGHEQYTRNMVTAASSADAAVVLVDATKLNWKNPALTLLPQTRRHSLLVQLLRVPSIVFAINKLDAVEDSTLAYANISKALQAFCAEAKITVTAMIPMSALIGTNVVAATKGWCGYSGASLLELLETLPNQSEDTSAAFAMPVQWVEKFSSSSDTSQGRRVFWGRIAAGLAHIGADVTLFPSGKLAKIAQVLSATRAPLASQVAGQSVGIILDQEADLSRGDWILDSGAVLGQREMSATVAWLDDEDLVAGRVYQALHGHRWVKAKVKSIDHVLDIRDLAQTVSTELKPNAIGRVTLQLAQAIPAVPYAQSRTLGAMILVDPATNKTSGAVLIQ
ncbi:MAG: GTP-binding protein [Cytophagales bacterium]|nr:GTP-binding protein [Cytophagales bacterium]